MTTNPNQGPALLIAARAVLAAWESGDLAAAVRQLQEAADSCEPATPDEIAAAEAMCLDGIAVDDDALVSRAETCAWVQAWVLIEKD